MKYNMILTEDFLYNRHVELGKSLYEISREVGCDHKTVSSWLHYHEIPYQEPKYNGRGMKDHPGWKGHGDISLTQFKNIQHNDKIRGIGFNLTIEELWDIYRSQDGKCALSGIEIGFVSSKRGNASLDRKDASKPYVLGNVWWVHTDVNYAKQSLSTDDFIELCKRVVNWNL